MADTPPITLTLTGKLFIQFAGQELIEVGQVEIPFVAAVIGSLPSGALPGGER